MVHKKYRTFSANQFSSKFQSCLECIVDASGNEVALCSSFVAMSQTSESLGINCDYSIASITAKPLIMYAMRLMHLLRPPNDH